MKKDTKDINEIIGKVLAGEADQYDFNLLQDWLDASKKNRDSYERMKRMWMETSSKEEYDNRDKVYQRMIKKREDFILARGKEESVYKHVKTFSLPWRSAGVAAALILAIGLSYLFIEDEPVKVVEVTEDISWVVKENPAGQKSKIVLSDGTIVWLNSESELSYLPNFKDSVREIKLLGEAFFQVAKDSLRPFIVEAGNLKTTAIGTAFNVRYYSEDSVITIFLAEGKVKVEGANLSTSTIYLDPGWGVNTGIGNSGIQKFQDQIVKWTSWKDGMLFFDNAGLSEVIRTCERWYDVEFTVKGKIPDHWLFNGRFKNEALENVLESMRYGKNFNYRINNRHVELIFKP